jgi:K+-sensing histidine kinase KdpD
MLGARLLLEEGEDVAAVAVRVARAQRSTYLLMGPPSGRRRLARLGEPLLMRLVRGLPGVDVRVVSDPTQRQDAGEVEEQDVLYATDAD